MLSLYRLMVASSQWGGGTGYQWERERKFSVYLFDRESGRLALRLVGLRIAVTHLAFSLDGTRLVVVQGGSVRVAD